VNKLNEIISGINSYDMEFEMQITKHITLSIIIKYQNKNWEWSYYGRNKAGVLENWDLFTYVNKQFVGPRSIALTKKTREKINLGFHEMIKQLKYDNSYRLKILPVLSDEMRDLWNTL